MSLNLNISGHTVRVLEEHLCVPGTVAGHHFTNVQKCNFDDLYYLGVDFASKLSRLSIDAKGGPLLIRRSLPLGVVMMKATIHGVAGGKRGLASNHNRGTGALAREPSSS